MAIQSIRGMHDLFGDEMREWQFVEKRVRACLEDFGFQEIRTPVLESIDVFKQTVGEDTDIVQKQMYTVQKGDETLAMRPEGTAAFMRAVIQHQLHKQPGTHRYFYYLPMYRHERPQKGRMRQFFQFGAELINDSSPEADVELIALLDHIYKKLGLIQYEIEINSVGCNDCRPGYRQALQDYFKPHLAKLCGQCQSRFERAPLRILDCKNPDCQKLVEGAPLFRDHWCDKCTTHMKGVRQGLEALGLKYNENPLIVRGLDYYSRTAFEFVSDLLGAQSALVGGGRYDRLAERFGQPEIPAVGFALGMERLMLALKASNANLQDEQAPLYFLIPKASGSFEWMFQLAVKLKSQGVRVEMSYDREKAFKAALKRANKEKAKLAVIAFEDEWDKQSVQVKDMFAGKDPKTVKKDELESYLLQDANTHTQNNVTKREGS